MTKDRARYLSPSRRAYRKKHKKEKKAKKRAEKRQIVVFEGNKEEKPRSEEQEEIPWPDYELSEDDEEEEEDEEEEDEELFEPQPLRMVLVVKEVGQASKPQLLLQPPEPQSNKPKQRAAYVDEENASKKPTQKNKKGASKSLPVTWTADEVYMLKLAVHHFAVKGKCHDWVKIRAFGSHVFKACRTNETLKDKWKNLVKAGDTEL